MTSAEPRHSVWARGAPRLAVLGAVLAAVVFVLGTALARAVQLPGFSADASVTLLTAPGATYSWVMRTTFVVVAMLLLGVAAGLPRASRAARFALAGAALGSGLLGVWPRVVGESSWPHALIGIAALAALAAAPVAGRGVRLIAWRLALVAGLPVAAALDGAYAPYETVVVSALLGWLVAAAVAAWWASGHRLGSREARLTGATALLTAGCLLGGITATVVAPVSVATENFSARLSISPAPTEYSRVVIPTLLGDLRVGFGGMAPGVRVSPQVRSGITEAIGQPGSSLQSLQPTQEEIDTVIGDAVRGIALRFLQGGALVAVVAIGLRWLWSRRRPGPRTLVAAGAGFGCAVALLGVCAGTAYRGEPREFTASGLLGAVQQNARLFDDVSARSEQVAPYLRNLVAMSAALRERYEAIDPPAGERALRVLLVSDIHGADAYPMIRSLVEHEEVDVVIDAGDLLNFGTVQEGEISGVFAGIASLGVPYVFVRGNHDATSAQDGAVLARMAQIPNVVLLQPNPGLYQELHIGGISIAGFNDPRWFGDDGRNSPQKMQAPKEGWQRTFADRIVPDVVVSHEPWAVQGIAGAGVLINGHMHTPFREGNRIQAGTFTGGGPLTHFIVAEGGEEMVGQPSAFDILDFGANCRLSALTRYRFENVVEGRPSYDDLSLVNGSVVDTRPVDPLRTCRASDPMRVVAIAAR